MYETRELRWFFDFPPPQFAAWTGDRERRTDWYAPIVDASSSLKLRQSQLEAKFLVNQSTATPFHRPHLATRPQVWKKIEIQLASADELRLAVLEGAHWLPIHKDRRVRYYAAQTDRRLAAQEDRRRGVQVEWTHVTLRGAAAWTFGLEIAATLDWDCLDRALAVVGEELELEWPAFRDARSYPEWIADQLASRG